MVCHVSSRPSYALDIKVKTMNFGFMFVSILWYCAYEIWYMVLINSQSCEQKLCLGNIFVTLIWYLVIVYIVMRLSGLTYYLDFWTQVQIIKIVYAQFNFFLPFNVALRYLVYLYMNQYNVEVISHLWSWPQNSHNCFQVSSPTDLKSKIQFYMTKMHIMSD